MATVCHLSEKPLAAGDRVLLKHTTRTVKAIVKEISAKLDISDPLAASGADSGDEFDWDDAPATHTLNANDIGRVVLRTASPILLEPYAADRETGSFLLIDPASGDTLTAGNVRRSAGSLLVIEYALFTHNFTGDIRCRVAGRHCCSLFRHRRP